MKKLTSGLAAILALLPAAAMAHTGTGAHIDAMHGFLHPLTGLDHVLAMVAVGVFAARLCQRPLCWRWWRAVRLGTSEHRSRWSSRGLRFRSSSWALPWLSGRNCRLAPQWRWSPCSRSSTAMHMALKEALPGRSLATLRVLWWRPRFCMRLGSCLAGRWNAWAAGLRSTRADWWVRRVPSPVPRS